MKLLILEDEEATASVLKKTITEYFTECQVIGIASDTAQALKYCFKSHPDIIIMDITVGHSISFELFEYIDPLDCTVIFLCTHKEFAFQAVQYGAVSYLLKPVNPVELVNALNKALKFAEKRKARQNVDTVKQSEAVISLYDNYVRRLVDPRSLVKIRADGSYSWACLEGGKTIHLSRHLKYYENQLKGHGFIRTHKTVLCNPLHIVEYLHGNNPMIRLSDGSKEPLSRSKRIEITQLLSGKISSI